MNQTVQVVYEQGVLRPETALLHLQEGQRALVTVQPLAELDSAEYARRHAEVLRRMEAEGMIEHLPLPEEPLPQDWKPLVIEGEPLSETIIKMRRGC